MDSPLYKGKEKTIVAVHINVTDKEEHSTSSMLRRTPTVTLTYK